MAWLDGYASLADGHHPSAPEPSGKWESRVMELALADADCAPSEVDCLIAHATGTPKGDAAEIRAINTTFDRRDLVVTGLKGHTGHTGASAGAMNILATIEAMQNGRLVNVAGTTTVDPDVAFDVVLREPRSVDVEVAQINAFGFGGQNASVVLRRP